VQVAHQIRQRHQFVFNMIGNLLGHRAIRITREQAIEVALVDRRGPTSDDRSR
jgi:hypothetical protein